MSRLKVLQQKSNIRPSETNAVYLPGLNGFRAIAATAVVLSHTTLALDSFGLNSKIFGTDAGGNAKGFSLAGNGVTIFFTLSGFLITYLMLKEKEVSAVNIKNFYVRRALRIWPLYYLYIGCCLVTAFYFDLSTNLSVLPFYVLLAANIPFILHTTLPFLDHYWSLGVEEQFYLFFPHIAKRSNQKFLRIAIVAIVFMLLLKFLFWLLEKGYGIQLPYFFITVTRFHIMLIGAVGAIFYYAYNQQFVMFATNLFVQLISWLCIFLIAINKFHIASVIDSEIISVISVLLIIGQITKQNNIINLENRVCDFIGKISYGIYVVHPLIIFFLAKMLGVFKSNRALDYVTVYVLVLTGTILTAYFSYTYFEKYFLKWKGKYATIKSYSVRAAQ